MIVKIYRLEHPIDHHGPYRLDSRHSSIDTHKLDDMCSYHSYSSNEHPAGSDDIPEWRWKSDYYFGCNTLNDLKWWFFNYWNDLKSMGFLVHEIEIDSVHVLQSKSGKQIAFKKDKVLNINQLQLN